MSMATVMSQMPDVWQRVLAEHVPDHHGRCRACWSPDGGQASWPCQAFKVADEARALAEGYLPVPSAPAPRASREIADWPLEPRYDELRHDELRRADTRFWDPRHDDPRYDDPRRDHARYDHARYEEPGHGWSSRPSFGADHRY